MNTNTKTKATTAYPLVICGVFAAFIFTFSEAVPKTNGVCRTFPDAHTAANTFGMVRRFRHVHSHFASFCAFSAGYTFAGIHSHLKQRNLVQKGIERTKRTQPFAERSVKQHAYRNYRNQNTEFPSKQCSECRSNTEIYNG